MVIHTGLKALFPITGHAETAVPLLDQCGRNGIVVAVRRDRSDVLKSIERWKPNVRDTTDFGNDYDAFWAFWEKREPLTIDFKDLFEPKKMAAVLDDICERVGTTRKASYVSAPSPNDRKKIYASKVTTRLLGRRAPLVNTTIYTLKA